MTKSISALSILALAFTVLSGTIFLDNLFNYANPAVPTYITKDNTNSNPITDEGATLGRVLFYDVNLSSNNTISCASCHIQEFAFGDTAVVSQGVNDVTGRHSMRLINARFADEEQFFWDERAADLETQTSMPIRDHAEMGYSGTAGDPDFNDLLAKLDTIDYYNHLFNAAFGDTVITEERIQFALAQFVRSIQSFDSKFDAGRATAPNDAAPFANFTAEENQGKNLFLAPPQFDPNGNRTGGGLGCAGCHRPPEFDIDPASLNNGIIGVVGSPGTTDLTNTLSPSLRDVVNANGVPNGPFMHNGIFTDLLGVINHYDQPLTTNPEIDPRLTPGGNLQNLNMTLAEKNAVIAFLGTLTGTDVYTNEKWSDPFAPDGQLTIEGSTLAIHALNKVQLKLYPNPVQDYLTITVSEMNYTATIYDGNGRMLISPQALALTSTIDMQALPSGVYLVVVKDLFGQVKATERVLKR
jgi:cytochrome c peroxidase